MLKQLFTIILFLQTVFCYSQNNVLIHIIKAGESITTIAKMYKTSIKDIYTINNLTDKSIIKAGQKLYIPMGKTAVAKKVAEEPKKNKKITIHVVEAGETLYKIARDNNVSVNQLRTWNNLTDDNITIGESLYFSQQRLTKSTQEISIVQDQAISKSLKIEADSDNTAKVVDAIIEAKKSEVKEAKKIENIIVDEDQNEVGAFEKMYNPSQKYIMGLCGTFKTISGWKDKKYYALMNDAENGSIVKVKYDNKVIYAKVLGPLPNIREENILKIRISNAAAAALGFANERTEVKIEL